MALSAGAGHIERANLNISTSPPNLTDAATDVATEDAANEA
ncbi:MAG: hypothetical protein QE278_00145 [Limnobacter sp.]|nr:hypothetical protein [Limnobacter sp.]